MRHPESLVLAIADASSLQTNRQSRGSQHQSSSRAATYIILLPERCTGERHMKVSLNKGQRQMFQEAEAGCEAPWWLRHCKIIAGAIAAAVPSGGLKH
jgi:hypothetical protein